MERNLSRFSSLVVREMGGGELPAVWIPGKQRQGEKKKKKKMSLSTTQRFPPFDLCSLPRRLRILHADFSFFFFSFSFRFSRQLGSFERPPPPPRRNVPIFPVFLEEEEDRRLAKERGGRIRGEKDPGRSGIAIGRKRKRWKRCPHRYIL